MIYNQSCGTVGALSLKAKKHRNELAHFCVFSFRDFCLFAIMVFFEVPLVLSFQGKNRKKNSIHDILYRCQPHKLKFSPLDCHSEEEGVKPSDEESTKS